jgi:hypothetical protein
MGRSRRAKFDARIVTGCFKKKSQELVRLIWFATRYQTSVLIQLRFSRGPLRCTDGVIEVGKSSLEFANRGLLNRTDKMKIAKGAA